MKTLLAAAAVALLLTVPALPVATAAHAGPCWHEYAEAALYVALTRDVKGGGRMVGACVDGILPPPLP